MTNTLELLLRMCVCGACLFCCCFFTLLHASLSSSRSRCRRRSRSNNNKCYSNTLCLIFVVSFLTHYDCFLSFCIICRLFPISFHVEFVLHILILSFLSLVCLVVVDVVAVDVTLVVFAFWLLLSVLSHALNLNAWA